MIDVRFYMKVHELKQRIANGEHFDKEFILDQFESCRSKEPVIFNIETTNACNMRCKMCPRTTMMTRKIETLDMEAFERIVAQVKPHSEQQWAAWQSFAEEKYGVDRNGMGENHFFLHILIVRMILLESSPLTGCVFGNLVGFLLSDTSLPRGLLSFRGEPGILLELGDVSTDHLHCRIISYGSFLFSRLGLLVYR